MTPPTPTRVSPAHLELLTTLYAAFNARDIDRVLAGLHPDVEWPNGMDGGWVHGRDAVRDYWTKQWGQIDPRVEPEGFAAEAPDRTIVHVRQVIRDRSGALLAERMVEHVYTIKDGLVTRMEIRGA